MVCPEPLCQVDSSAVHIKICGVSEFAISDFQQRLTITTDNQKTVVTILLAPVQLYTPPPLPSLEHQSNFSKFRPQVLSKLPTSVLSGYIDVGTPGTLLEFCYLFNNIGG
jgi:hypothetical protein